MTVCELRNEPLDRIIQLEAAFLKQEKRSIGCGQLCVREDAKDVIEPQWYLRLRVDPSKACHVRQLSPDKHGRRETGEKSRIYEALHGGVCGPEVISGGCDFHVFLDL